MRFATFALLALGSVVAPSTAAPANVSAPVVSAEATSAVAPSPVGSAPAGSAPAGSASAGTESGNATSTPAASVAVPSATVAPQTPVPGQDLLPPPQAWCMNGGDSTFCPGALLQDVQLSEIFPDSKTFVDKPTKLSLNETMAAFNQLGPNRTVGDMVTFVENYFKPERQELEEIAIEGFNENPEILNNVTDPIYKAWVTKVNSYWTLLVRQTNESAVCRPGECESSLIPLNHTIVVPGGRYGEIYYWDSFWILKGLLASELNQYAWNLLQNFMDLVETYGFLPNGGRKYYLNRSQPPVFVQMVDAYVRKTGNFSILERALPLMHEELEWFQNNRTILVTSPYSNKTHRVAHYAVVNSAPRPEGYIEDYNTVMDADPPLNESQRADLYSELATGAESGWDYSGRWCKQPFLNKTNNEAVLRTLNIRAIIPVDLTALLAGDHSLLARLYESYETFLQGNGNNNGQGNGTENGNGNGPENGNVNGTENGNASDGGQQRRKRAEETAQAAPPNATAQTSATAVPTAGCFGAVGGPATGGGPGSGQGKADGQCVPATPNMTIPESPNAEKIKYHRSLAANYTAAIHDLHWDPVKAYWYDFNTTANERSPVYTPAGLWPLWQNIVPPALKSNETMALQVASGVRYILGRYAGAPSVASLLDTGLQWDFPNVWPPHVYTSIKAMQTLDRVLPTVQNVSTTYLTSYSDVTAGQLGLNLTELPPQPQSLIGNTSLVVPNLSGVRWPQAVAVEIAQRYMTSAFCSWYSTGGRLPDVLPSLPLSDLNATGTYTGDDGHMFEKFNVTDPDAAGGGGEYTVVVGFGWTNGVVLWAAGEFGKYLPRPSCPLLPNGLNNTATNPVLNETDINAMNNTNSSGQNPNNLASAGFRRASIFGLRF